MLLAAAYIPEDPRRETECYVFFCLLWRQRNEICIINREFSCVTFRKSLLLLLLFLVWARENWLAPYLLQFLSKTLFL